MKVYQYAIIYRDKHNTTHKMGMGTQAQMFRSALALDSDNAYIYDCQRETYHVDNGIAKLIKIESYVMGKPTKVLWEA